MNTINSRDIWVGDNWGLQVQLVGETKPPGYCKRLEDSAQQPFYRFIRLEKEQRPWEGEGHAEHQSIRVKCSWLDCHCYPFACFSCKICKGLWWAHCRKGRAPKSVCQRCWLEQRKLTSEVLNYKVATRELTKGSPEWWEVFIKGINPEFHCYHSNEPLGPFLTDIVQVKCRKLVKRLRCDTPQLNTKNWNSRRSKWERGNNPTPEEYLCCREDGLPCNL